MPLERVSGFGVQVHVAVRFDHRAERHPRRCPNWLPPTPTKHSCGRARAKSRHTFNYDLINSRDPTSQLSSVWHIPAVPRREKSHGLHPTQKPLRILRRAVLASTREGDLIFDPFCGSGTTGVAAKELDRFFVGAETKREYAELAGRRIGAAERGSRRGRFSHWQWEFAAWPDFHALR